MRLVKFAVIGLIIFGSFLVSLGNADVNLKTYESLKDTQEFKMYISAVGEGFSWANTELTGNGRSPLYCQPPKLGLTFENYLRILKDYIEKNKELVKRLGDNFPVEVLLLRGLQETFPCK